MNKIIIGKDYSHLLKDIKSIMEKGLGRAYQAVDNIKVQTYWQIGERIVREELEHKQRAGYGEMIVTKLADDLNTAVQTLRHIVRFYRTYPIVSAVRRELSWSHYKIISYLEVEERQFYEAQVVLNAWSTRELEKRIKQKEYLKVKKSGQLVIKLPQQLPVPEEVFKNSYEWNFLDLGDNHDEKQLEKALLINLQKILLEFGSGFAFMASQQKILVAGQWHKVDLVFYHRLLKCIIVVELKTEKFKPEFIGQVNKYLTYFRENKLDGERDPIGLIVCKKKNDEEVHYALGNLKREIFVADYKVYLPSEKEIIGRIK